MEKTRKSCGSALSSVQYTAYCIIHDQCNIWRNTSAPKKHVVSPNGSKKICFTRKPLVGVNPTTEKYLLGEGEGEMRVIGYIHT